MICATGAEVQSAAAAEMEVPKPVFVEPVLLTYW